MKKTTSLLAIIITLILLAQASFSFTMTTTGYPANNLTIDGTSMTLNGTHKYNIIKIINGATLYIRDYNGNASTGKLELYAREIFVDATSSINANGKGYHGGVGDAQAGDGPGGGGAGDTGHPSGFGGAGAGYGGNGGGGWGTGNQGSCGTTYGDENNAGQWMGSGGGTGTSSGSHGGNGGGIIVLNAENITIEGSITSDGSIGSGRGGGGSGGGINITADKLTISGHISTDGSNGGNDAFGSGGGGGGRITLTGNNIIITGITSANPGSGSGWALSGSSGTPGTITTNNNVEYTSPSSTTYKISDLNIHTPTQPTSATYKLTYIPGEPLIGHTTSATYKLCLGYFCLDTHTASPSVPEQKGNITGTVTDEYGTPLESATITAQSALDTYSNTTNPSGTYTIRNLNTSTYTATAEKTGYIPKSIPNIDINNTETAIINFILQSIPTTQTSKDTIVHFQTKEDITLQLGTKNRAIIHIKNPTDSRLLVPLHIGSPDNTFKNFIQFENTKIYPHNKNITLRPNEEKLIPITIFAGKLGTYGLVVGPDNNYENKQDTKRITIINKNAGIFAQSPGLHWTGFLILIILAATLTITAKTNKTI